VTVTVQPIVLSLSNASANLREVVQATKAMSSGEALGLKPNLRNPDVRNFREGAGDVTMGGELRPMAKGAPIRP